MGPEEIREMNFEMAEYALKRLKTVARDLSESGSDDLSDILFVHAAQMDEEICKIRNRSLKESFDEVRQQGYDKALRDICDVLVQKLGTENETVAEVTNACYALKGEKK